MRHARSQAVVSDPRRFRLAFLPTEFRKLQKDGLG
jgi:hypothetical protein